MGAQVAPNVSSVSANGSSININHYKIVKLIRKLMEEIQIVTLSLVYDLLASEKLTTLNISYHSIRTGLRPDTNTSKQKQSYLAIRKTYLDQSTNFLDSFKYDHPKVRMSLATKK